MSDKLSFDEIIRSGVTPTEAVLSLPNMAVVIVGQSGVGKTHLLATFKKRLLVQQTDPDDKVATYENLGFLPSPVQSNQWSDFQDFYSPKDPDNWIVRVEFFNERDPRNAKMMPNFMARMNDIERDIRAWKVASIGLDSVTFLELGARFYNKYSFHPTNKRGADVQDERIHYAAAGRAVEEWIVSRYPGLQRLCNVVIIAHTKAKTDESSGENEDQREEKKVIAAPGQTSAKIAQAFSEVYRLYMDDAGQRWLQTSLRPSQNNFECKSTRQLTDPTQAHWKAIERQLIERYQKRAEALNQKPKED